MPSIGRAEGGGRRRGVGHRRRRPRRRIRRRRGEGREKGGRLARGDRRREGKWWEGKGGDASPSLLAVWSGLVGVCIEVGPTSGWRVLPPSHSFYFKILCKYEKDK